MSPFFTNSVGPTPRWQCSTRSLFVLTAVVSVILAIVVKWPIVIRIFLIVAALGFVIAAMFKSAIFATSDRRPRLAMLSWAILAALFLLFSAGTFRLLFYEDLILILPIFCIMIVCLITCIVGVCRSYSLVSRKGVAGDRFDGAPPAVLVNGSRSTES